MLRLALFLAASAVILVFSRRSLAQVRAHGFYRFFAFELLAALILLNAPAWFRDPLSKRQLISWALGAASIALAVEGFRLLRSVGSPSSTAGLETDLAFEKTTRMVTVGAYRFIRHPMYASLLALVWCAYLKNPLKIESIALALTATAALIATAVVEEKENLARFGQTYADYMRATSRFVPFVF
jgi:protein-S-isoprenylcysteine O-methyltransferase Ste14